MPLWGTLDVAPLLERAPAMPSLDTDPLTLEGVDILQLSFEISEYEPLVPPALHPTIPATMTLIFWRTREFALAQLRIGCRAGIRPRGFLVGAFVDDDAAAAMLSDRWGFRCERAEVRLARRFDRVEGCVPGVAEAALVDPEPISGGDILWVASMHLARAGGRARLVQVDPEYAFQKADRGRPVLTSFDPAAFGEPRVQPVYPISATWAQCDVTLPRIRYVCDPDVPALQGTEKVG